MAERQLPLPGEIVKKSNVLARARWPVSSVWEPRLVALVAARVRSDDVEFQEYEIPIQEIIQEKQDGQTYQRVAAVIENLMGRVVTISDPAKPKSWKKYTLFSKCELDSERNVLIARFDPDMMPHYLALSKHFTQYNLLEFLTLPSIYSQKLFELLKSWNDQQEKTIDLAELFVFLNVPESHRKDFAAFRRRVLEKAYNDINTRTKLRFEWEPIKQGKAVVAIKFIFSKNKRSTRTTKAVEKESKQNNALFLAATACLKKKGGTCMHPSKKKQCTLCLRLLQNK